MKKCTNCGRICHDEQYPEIVFRDDKNIICENCSIDFEETVNGIKRRD